MPKATSIFAIIFSICLVVQPILPFMEYALFQNYIIENLCIEREIEESCCKGSCHLEKRLESASVPVSDENKPVSQTTSFKLLEYDIVTTAFQTDEPRILPKKNDVRYMSYQFTFLKTCFHPPRLG